MIDIETLGTVPGCVVTGFGAVAWRTGNWQERKEVEGVFSVADQLAQGLKIDADTLAWTLDHSSALATLRAALLDQDPAVYGAIGVAEFIQSFDPDEVWANGPDFDLRILEALFAAVRHPFPVAYWKSRCFRTWRVMAGLPKPANGHDALSDARNQAAMLEGEGGAG